MLISIDPGKYATKAVTHSKKLYFPTRITCSPSIDPAGNTYLVTHKGETYLIGEQAEQQSYDVSKAELVHKLATYTAITQLLGFSTRIDLVIGCPLNNYKNKELREEYRRYILDEGTIRITVNNIDYRFTLDNCLVLPESAGVIYRHPDLFTGRRVAVIDLGGLNMNFCIYDNYIPQVSSMFTVNLGGNELHTAILNSLNTKYGITLASRDIPHIIKNGGLKLYGKLDEGSVPIVGKVLEEYISRILQEIKKNAFSLDTMDVVFIGGTSSLIKENILRHVPHAVIPAAAEWCNAEGFFRIGEIKFGYETE